jgi:hypothetical protein
MGKGIRLGCKLFWLWRVEKKSTIDWNVLTRKTGKGCCDERNALH